MKKQLLISLTILLFLLLGTTLVVLYGKGYRFGFEKGKPDLSSTGLLVAKSNPDSAQVFINGHLTTATDSTLNLAPGEYTIRIYKEGYFPWEKKIKMQKEVVVKAEALLFATAPKLESLTSTGVENPTLDPSLTRLVYTIASQSARKNGVYVLDMAARPILNLQSAITQLTDDTFDTFSRAHLSWSPDGQDLLASISGNLRSPTTYLLAPSSFNANPRDVSATLDTIISAWEKEKKEKEKTRNDSLKTVLRQQIAQNFNVIAWSPDETKILYVASVSATIPIIIKPPLIGSNQTPEQRSLKKDSVYVYDIKEDKNFKLEVGSGKWEVGNSEGHQPLRWLSDSRHLLFVHDKKIDIMEYDSTNQTTVYAGPFIEDYVFPYPNGSKIVILTNLGNPAIIPNLYTVGLK